MAYLALARKLRPKNFTEVAAQVPTIQALINSLKVKKVHHAYLFTGTRGIGKTTIARILAKAICCKQGVTSNPCGICENCRQIDAGNHPDVLELDAASRTKVEDTREILDNLPYSPYQANYRVLIIDEVHMLSNHSFNALLKTLEEPPEHVKFILATTDLKKIPITILSRCLHFELKPFTDNEIIQQLSKIFTQEQINYQTTALPIIANRANGSMRDALSLAEQILAFNNGEISSDACYKILKIPSESIIIQILNSLYTKDVTKILDIIADIQGSINFQNALNELQHAIHNLAVLQMYPSYQQGLIAKELLALAAKIEPDMLQLWYEILCNGKQQLPYAPDAKSGFEMVILRMLAFSPVVVTAATSDNGVINVIDNIESSNTKKIDDIGTSIGINTSEQVTEQVKDVDISTDIDKPVQSEQVRDIKTLQQVQIPEQENNIETLQQAQMYEQLNDKETLQQIQIPEQVNDEVTAQLPEWYQLIPELKLNGLTKIIAENCTIKKFSNKHLLLSLNHKQQALLTDKHKLKIGQAINQYAANKLHIDNIKVTIECQPLVENPLVENKDNLDNLNSLNNQYAASQETPAARFERINQAKQQEIEQSIQNNPAIQKIINTFDAKIESINTTD